MGVKRDKKHYWLLFEGGFGLDVSQATRHFPVCPFWKHLASEKLGPAKTYVYAPPASYHPTNINAPCSRWLMLLNPLNISIASWTFWAPITTDIHLPNYHRIQRTPRDRPLSNSKFKNVCVILLYATNMAASSLLHNPSLHFLRDSWAV